MIVERVPRYASPLPPPSPSERRSARAGRYYALPAEARRPVVAPISRPIDAPQQLSALLDAARAGDYVDTGLLPDWHPDSLLYRGP